MIELVLPNVGFGMEEGRVLAWLKQPGDAIRKGEAVAEIEGDKATVELEATVSGTLADIVVLADQIVAVGTVLARIQPDGVAAVSVPATQPQPEANAAPSGNGGQRISPVAQRLADENRLDLAAVRGSGPGGRITRDDVEAQLSQKAAQNGGRVLAAPAVRKLARDHHIDLAAVAGTGPEGRRTRADVEAYLSQTAAVAAPAPAPIEEAPVVTPVAEAKPVANVEGRTVVPMSQTRKVIARRLAQSAREAPHFFTTAQLDVTDALERLPQGVGINALMLYLTVQALKAVPALNATYENDTLYQYDAVHLSVAVALPDGLLSPVLQHADDFSLTGLAGRVKDLIGRARAGKLRADEMGGGTFTVSNLGVVEQVERFTAILNPPQVGILAIGTAKDRPLVINRGLHIRTTTYVTLSCDHRVVDGMVAARFLQQFDQQLQRFAQSGRV